MRKKSGTSIFICKFVTILKKTYITQIKAPLKLVPSDDKLSILLSFSNIQNTHTKLAIDIFRDEKKLNKKST